MAPNSANPSCGSIDYQELPEISCPICGDPTYELVTIRFDDGPIVKCLGCDHKYLNPTLPDYLLSEIYENYHESDSDEAVVALVNSWFNDPAGPYQNVLQQLNAVDGLVNRRVLEVGCSTGRFLHECSKGGAHVTGVDLSPGAARMAKQFFGLDVITKSLEQALDDEELAIGSFDIVFAFEIIEHVRKPGDFTEALFRLLKPGGEIFVSTPNFHMFEIMGPIAEVVNQWPEHLHFFDPDSLKQTLIRSGFQEATVTSVSLSTYGERQKQKVASNQSINAFWQRARKIPAMQALKDRVFSVLDAHRQSADLIGWNGRCLLAHGRKATTS